MANVKPVGIRIRDIGIPYVQTKSEEEGEYRFVVGTTGFQLAGLRRETFLTKPSLHEDKWDNNSPPDYGPCIIPDHVAQALKAVAREMTTNGVDVPHAVVDGLVDRIVNFKFFKEVVRAIDEARTANRPLPTNRDANFRVRAARMMKILGTSYKEEQLAVRIWLVEAMFCQNLVARNYYVWWAAKALVTTRGEADSAFRVSACGDRSRLALTRRADDFTESKTVGRLMNYKPLIGTNEQMYMEEIRRGLCDGHDEMVAWELSNLVKERMGAVKHRNLVRRNGRVCVVCLWGDGRSSPEHPLIYSNSLRNLYQDDAQEYFMIKEGRMVKTIRSKVDWEDTQVFNIYHSLLGHNWLGLEENVYKNTAPIVESTMLANSISEVVFRGRIDVYRVTPWVAKELELSGVYVDYPRYLAEADRVMTHSFLNEAEPNLEKTSKLVNSVIATSNLTFTSNHVAVVSTKGTYSFGCLMLADTSLDQWKPSFLDYLKSRALITRSKGIKLPDLSIIKQIACNYGTTLSVDGDECTITDRFQNTLKGRLMSIGGNYDHFEYEPGYFDSPQRNGAKREFIAGGRMGLK